MNDQREQAWGFDDRSGTPGGLPDDLPIPQTGGLARLTSQRDALCALAFAALSAGGSPEQAAKLLMRRFRLEVRATPGGLSVIDHGGPTGGSEMPPGESAR